MFQVEIYTGVYGGRIVLRAGFSER